MERRFILQGLETQASIGIYDYERVAPQRIIIDAELCLYATTEPLDDQIGSTLNYDIIRETILDIVSAQHYDLQETLARKLFDALEKRLEPSSIPACVLVIADFQYKGAFAMDSEINFVACLTEIMSECKFKNG